MSSEARSGTGAKRRVACIGAGYWGKNLVRNFCELGALELICEADVTRHPSLAEDYPSVGITSSFDEALADTIDGVAIATPAETHGGLVRKALEAGKHVFVEKPLSLSVPEAEELVRIASDRQRTLMVGHLLWYHPAVLKLKEMVDAGSLGRIQYVYSNRLNLGKIRREENILWSFAPHDISVILGLLQEMPDEVWACGGNYLHQRIADVTTTHLSFPSGVRAHVFVSWLHPFKEQKLVVIGDRGMAVFNDTVADKLVFYSHRVDWRDSAPVPHKADPQPIDIAVEEPLRRECAAFLEAVGGGAQPRTDGQEALRVLRVLAAAQRHLDISAGQKDRRPMVGPKSTDEVFVHPSTEVDEGVEIGKGTKIWHFGHLMSGSRLGRNCRVGQNVVIGPRAVVGDDVKIQNNVSVYEGVTLEDSVFCGPSMVFTNVMNPRSEIPRMSELRETRVRRGASLGANCTIVCGVTIGQYAFVGAGAVVLHDVPDYGVVVGNPARLIGWMCRCGERISLDGARRGTCPVCASEYVEEEGSLRLASDAQTEPVSLS